MTEKKPRIPVVYVLGAGATGTEVTRRLSGGCKVVVMDRDPGRVAAALGLDQQSSAMVQLVSGDTTSRMALTEAGVGRADKILVTTAPDSVSLETARILTREMGIHDVIVLLRDSSFLSRFQELDVETVPYFVATAAALTTKATGGNWSLGSQQSGRGEMIEVEIMPNSSVINKPLSSMHPRKWLVASIHRDGNLVIPHGSTTLEAGDRVLLVGEPGILPFVARFLRTGHSDFPLHYGTAVVVPVTQGTESHTGEISYLMKSTKAESLEFITCETDQERMDAISRAMGEVAFPFNFSCLGRNVLEHVARLAEDRDVGILVLEAEPLTFLQKIGLGRTRLIRGVEHLDSPVLIPRGSFPYRRILYSVTEPHLDLASTVLAIDVARIFDAQLLVATASPPDFVVGEGYAATMAKVHREIRKLAASYHIKVETRELSGNPVHTILEICREVDLMVLGLHKGKRTSPLNPGVEQNLIHRATCSVLAIPHLD